MTASIEPIERLDRIARPRLPATQLISTALRAFRTWRLRAALSALGIAIGIGIGAMVAVVGVSACAQANLISEIDALGTNLLTVAPGQTFLGANEVLPATSVPMIGHVENVLSDCAVYQVGSASVYRNPLVPSAQTGGIGVDAAARNLPEVMSTTMAFGHFLDSVSDRFPEAVLGAQAAGVLQISHVGGHVMLYLGNTWFTVVGIMSSATLDTSLDSTVFISLPVAQRLFATQPNPSEIYVRASQNDVVGVSDLLAATADPQNASGVNVSRPSDSLQARAAAKGQFTTLLLGLGAVALLVGAIGIANIMDLRPGQARTFRRPGIRADRRLHRRTPRRRDRRPVPGNESHAPQPHRSSADRMISTPTRTDTEHRPLSRPRFDPSRYSRRRHSSPPTRGRRLSGGRAGLASPARSSSSAQSDARRAESSSVVPALDAAGRSSAEGRQPHARLCPGRSPMRADASGSRC